MRKLLFTLLLALTAITMTAQGEVPKPKVSYKQITKLFHGKNPKSVLKGSGLKKYCYSYIDKHLGYCTFGYNVQYEDCYAPLVPLTDDAFGISYCDAGSGCWDIVFKDKAQLEAYKKEAVDNGFLPIYEQWHSFVEDNVEKKQLIYAKDIDEWMRDCFRIVFNGDYYQIRLELEEKDDLINEDINILQDI
ncbi:MAG: hypothetical protein J6W52_12215 [Bacteroidaceae bacterium]|nr:hypothetical protein [Bacteroidaceae bacterium]